MQVIDFYNRGGAFGRDNAPITDPSIKPLGLTESEKRDLVGATTCCAARAHRGIFVRQVLTPQSRLAGSLVDG